MHWLVSSAEIIPITDMKVDTKSGASRLRRVSTLTAPLFKSAASTEASCLAPSATPGDSEEKFDGIVTFLEFLRPVCLFNL